MIEHDPQSEALLRAALKEDIGSKDLTCSLLPATQIVKADTIFKEEGVLSGIEVAERVFRLIDDDLRFLPAAKDGEFIEPGRVIFYVEGPCRSILSAERTALNFLGRMSGIATLTRRFVDAVKGTPAAILDTRKTAPLLRHFDRAAVRAGGGTNHRFGLFDGILIKDNHLRVLRGIRFAEILKRVRALSTRKVPCGIKVKDLAETEEAVKCGFDYVLLDNFSVEQVRQAVAIRNKFISTIEFEVSGGIRLDNVRAYADCGVERISVGALTHSFKTTDISLNLL